MDKYYIRSIRIIIIRIKSREKLGSLLDEKVNGSVKNSIKCNVKM